MSYLASENGDRPSGGQQSQFSSSSSVAGHVEGSGSPPEPSSTAAVVAASVDEVPLSVWGLERVQKNGGAGAPHTWTCLWCNETFKQWNATKVLYHLAKIPKKDIRVCKVLHDPKSKALYFSMLQEKDKSYVESKKREAAFQATVGEGQQSLAVMFESSRQRVSSACGATGRQRVMAGSMTVEASTASQLTMAIADFIHSSGLSFSVTQGVYFQNVLKFARGVGASYKPPGREAVATNLLKLNYTRRMEK
jgi:hypothetical protein